VPGTVSLTGIGERAAIRAIRLAPKQLYSTVVDWGARRRIPRALRMPLYTTYSRLVGADLKEVELPLADYDSFGEFFARRLRAGAREASTDMTAVASPCDGKVGAFGSIADGSLLQAKGHHYRLADLLVDSALTAKLARGEQVTIYLSPADYHRVHAPMSARFLGYTYVPGARFPVGPFFTERIDGVFAENERLVLELETDSGSMALVLVGALGVGNLCLTDPRLESRELAGQETPIRVRFEEPISVARGQELGAFHLGSTVVLAFSPGMFRCDGLRFGQRVDCGESMGRLSPAPSWMVQ